MNEKMRKRDRRKEKDTKIGDNKEERESLKFESKSDKFKISFG